MAATVGLVVNHQLRESPAAFQAAAAGVLKPKGHGKTDQNHRCARERPCRFGRLNLDLVTS